MKTVHFKFEMDDEVIRKGAPNFSVTEKTALLNIINNYKFIMECKKSDRITWRQKDEYLIKICALFNSHSLENYSRHLTKFFDIKKKLERARNVLKNVRWSKLL